MVCSIYIQDKKPLNLDDTWNVGIDESTSTLKLEMTDTVNDRMRCFFQTRNALLEIQDKVRQEVPIQMKFVSVERTTRIIIKPLTPTTTTRLKQTPIDCSCTVTWVPLSSMTIQHVKDEIKLRERTETCSLIRVLRTEFKDHTDPHTDDEHKSFHSMTIFPGLGTDLFATHNISPDAYNSFGRVMLINANTMHVQQWKLPILIHSCALAGDKLLVYDRADMYVYTYDMKFVAKWKHTKLESVREMFVLGEEVFTTDLPFVSKDQQRVQVFSHDGVFVRSFTIDGIGYLTTMIAKHVDNKGLIYISDTFHLRVVVCNSTTGAIEHEWNFSEYGRTFELAFMDDLMLVYCEGFTSPSILYVSLYPMTNQIYDTGVNISNFDLDAFLHHIAVADSVLYIYTEHRLRRLNIREDDECLVII